MGESDMSALDDDPDAMFFKIMEGVVLEEPTDAVDYTKSTPVELAKTRQRLRDELFKLGELHNPNAHGEAGDLHAQLYAVNTAIKRRWPNMEIDND